MEKITFKKIKKTADLIAQKYKPEKIILFGSFARGKPTEDSDIDLLIIKKTKKKWLERQIEVGKIIDGEIATDTLIQTPSEIRRRLDLGDFFYRNILKKGTLLYEKSKK